MSSRKSFVEIKESLKSLVEPKSMFYKPSHRWQVNVFNSDSEVIYHYKPTTLYCILDKIYDHLYDYHHQDFDEFSNDKFPNILYNLYEECVSTSYSDKRTESLFINPLIDYDANFYTIIYIGDPRLEENHIQNFSIEAQSSALESISIITELIRKDEVDKLYEIRRYLDSL